MFWPASPLMRLRFGLDDGAAPWQPVIPATAMLFARCRFALFEGLRLLVRARDLRRVWLPAWICRPVVEAVHAAGLGVRVYDIDERLAPRLETIEPDRGDGLLVIHYFGLAQPLPRLRAFCDAYGLALIEDCAHALPDPAAPVRIGAVGDIAVFSLRKQLPVAGGGLLVVNEARLRAGACPPPPRVIGDRRELARLGLMVAERVAYALGLNPLALKNRLPVVDPVRSAGSLEVLREYAQPPGPSRLIAPLLRGLDWAGLIRGRSRSYTALAQELRRIPEIQVALPETPSGSVPLALPVWSRRSDALARALRRHGVEAICWPWGEQPPFSHALYPGAATWLSQSVFLPVATPAAGTALARLVAAVATAAGAPSPIARSHAGTAHRAA
jgi:selenocysteine lyase/cysteine desulfurase